MIWKRVIVAWMTLLALLLASAGASARTDVEVKSHVGAIDAVAAICIEVQSFASAEGHQENGLSTTTETSDVPDAARGLPRFTQTTASVLFRNGPFAGRSIGEVAAGLRSGAISAGELPVDVIVRGGQTLAVNTRSTLALVRAGIDPSKWTVVNRTGEAIFENLITQRLAANGLTEAGTDVLRITGLGKGASAIW